MTGSGAMNSDSHTSSSSQPAGGDRADGRTPEQLREVRITRDWLDHAEGSVLIEFGRTRVLCAASFTEGVPRWKKGSGSGWVTAEYAMLPRSEEHTSELQSRGHLVCRLLLEKEKGQR